MPYPLSISFSVDANDRSLIHFLLGQTIGQAFAMVNSKHGQLPPLEISEACGAPINNYDSQNIRNTLDHYLSELKRKRLSVPAADETAVQVLRRICTQNKCCRKQGSPCGISLNCLKSRASPHKDIFKYVSDFQVCLLQYQGSSTELSSFACLTAGQGEPTEEEQSVRGSNGVQRALQGSGRAG